MVYTRHFHPVNTKVRLFNRQTTRCDSAKLFINLNSAHPDELKTPIRIFAPENSPILLTSFLEQNIQLNSLTSILFSAEPVIQGC